MEETKDTALKSRITLVCTGKTHLKAGEVGLVFRTVDGDGGTGRERIYSHKNLKTTLTSLPMSATPSSPQ